MKEFIEKYQDRIHGVLSCFDRMLFRGYLPIMSGWQMAQFFNHSGIRFRELKTFLIQHAERVKRHAMTIAEQEGRPFQYLQEKIKKELDELEKETPSPQAAGAYRQALNSLREMEAAVHILSSESPERQELIRLRKAFEQAAQALRATQAAL